MSICTKIVDGDHNPPKGLDTPTPYLMLSSLNINDNTIMNLDKVRYLSKEQFEIENNRTQISNYDILFTSVGTLGRSCVYYDNKKICFQRSVSVIHTLINPYFLKLYFDTPKFQNFVIAEATGTAQKGFYLNQLSQCIIPVPPIEEQIKIVSKINSIFQSI